MTLPRHVGWSDPDPYINCDWNTTTSGTYTLSGTTKSSAITISNGCLIFQFTVDNTGGNTWNVGFYDKERRAAGDLVFETGSKTGDYTHVQNGNNAPIVYVDQDGKGKLWQKITGTAGNTFNIVMKVLRIF